MYEFLLECKKQMIIKHNIESSAGGMSHSNETSEITEANKFTREWG